MMRWRKVTLVGVGLLGGSLGLALKARGLAAKVTGYVRRENSIQECLAAGAVDEATSDLAMAVRDADLVVFCTPLAQMPALATTMRPALREGAVATDVGSVKTEICRHLHEILDHGGVDFVGSHPMAGSEKMGVAAARKDLFERAVCVVTPTEHTSLVAAEAVEHLWKSVGARVTRMTPELHDQLVSRSSHLPHVLAAALASFVLDPHSPPEQSKLCANGFRDSTRVASGSPEMWRDILLHNRKEITLALDQFTTHLAEFRALLQKNDPAEIENFFRQAKSLRDSWAAQWASPSPE